MSEDLSASLDKIAKQLEGINSCLTSIWHSRYQNGETDVLDPRGYADEYITLEECAERLHVSTRTLRNWMKTGMHNKNKGWKEGIHYVNIAGDKKIKGFLRVPWNGLVQSFAQNPVEKPLLQKKNGSVLYTNAVYPDDVADHPKL